MEVVLALLAVTVTIGAIILEAMVINFSAALLVEPPALYAASTDRVVGVGKLFTVPNFEVACIPNQHII